MRNYTLVLIFLIISQLLIAQSIERIEPPNWWVGMKNTSLQLMVYGKKIGDATVQINYPGVRVEKISQTPNPNYIFVDLTISPTAKAGQFDLVFSTDKKTFATKKYELKARSSNSANRKGFDNTDVLYLITPDRFANGDPSNDQVKGLKELPNRSNEGGRHGGDVEGLRQSLDYVKEMGFTAIWLNPVLENDMEEYSYHGYSTTDFYRVDPRFGTNSSYQKMAQEAQQKGIKLIMDMIVNHCGSFHWWMDDLPFPDWINQWPEYTQTNHQKTVVQDPYASAADKKQFVDGWFVPTMPDLNQRNVYMANYLVQNSIWWIEFAGLSGIRMGTYPYPDMDYMTEWTRRVMEEYPHFNVVGEEWNLDPSIVAYWQKDKDNPNGYTSDLKSIMDFPLQASVSKALVSEEKWGSGWITLYEALAKDFIYADPSMLVTFPDNHDMSRFYTQVNEDYDLFKLGIVYYMTMRGIPQIYYGTEILMGNPNSTSHGEIRSDFPGGWAGDQVNGFTGEGLSQQQKSAQEFFKNILNWRKTANLVHFGKLMHFKPQDGVYVYFRYNDREKLMVVLNKNKGATSLSLDRFEEMLEGVKGGTDVLSGKRLLFKNSLDLVPMGALVIELE